MIKKIDWDIKVDDMSLDFKDRLFSSRDLTKKDLNLSINDIHDYIDLNDIDSAVMRISLAIRKKENILIFGDYDVDGVMSTFSLTDFFCNKLGHHVDYHIPDRLTEGYGISDIAVDKILQEKKYSLIITVDNGISAIMQIQRLVDAGIDVIVTDHHECKEVLPNAYAVIDCKRPDNTYPYREMCGAGVVLKLIWALCDEFGLDESVWKSYIEYTAIATIADVMPLVDENRVIVQEGLNMIKHTKNLSIINLLRVADKLEKIDSLTSSDIAFYIAPLINASSRIGSVNTVMELLFTDSQEDALKLSDELKKLNEKRKEIETNILNEANAFLIKNYDFESINPIVVYGNNWHKGVIGIVASRLVDLYSKPVIVLSKTEDGLYHGSCRNYGSINMIKMLDAVSECIFNYGGHEGAAGVTIEEKNLNNFIEAINNYAYNNFSADTFKPVLKSDMLVNLNEITLENYNYINNFEPFGEGNHDPVFVVKGVKITSLRKIGQKEGAENAHLKITVVDKNKSIAIDGIGFYRSDYASIISVDDVVDIMFKPNINEWNGQRIPQMLIQDIHCSLPIKEGTSIEEDTMYREDGIGIAEMAEEYMIDINEYIPTKDECFYAFKALCHYIGQQPNRILIADLDILSLIINGIVKSRGFNINPFKLARIIEINTEAGYFNFKRTLWGEIILSLTDGKNIKRVADTDTYKILEEEKKLYD